MKRVIILNLLAACLLVAGAVHADTAGSSTRQQIIELIQKEETAAPVDPKLAESYLVQAAQISPDFPQIYEAWGHLYEGHMQFAKAEEKFRKWQELQPDSYIPYVYLGLMEQRQLHYAESNTFFIKAKTIHATVGVLDSICHNDVQLQQWQNAISACTDAIALDEARYKKTDGYAYSERVKAYMATGQKEKAQEDRKALVAAKLDVRWDNILSHGGVLLIGLLIVYTPLQYLAMYALVYTRGRPLFYSQLWTFLPLMMLAAYVLFLPEVLDPQKALAACALVALFWLGDRTLSVLGAGQGALKDALVATLGALHLSWEEKNIPFLKEADASAEGNSAQKIKDFFQNRRLSFTTIHIPQVNLDIRIQGDSEQKDASTLTFLHKNKDNNSKEAEQNILSGLRKYFSEGGHAIRHNAIGMDVAVKILRFALILLAAYIFFRRALNYL